MGREDSRDGLTAGLCSEDRGDVTQDRLSSEVLTLTSTGGVVMAMLSCYDLTRSVQEDSLCTKE